MEEKGWYTETEEEIIKKFGSSKNGLSSHVAIQRIKNVGYNEIKEKKRTSTLKIFARQFESFIVWILIIAVVISAFLGETLDAIVIVVILILNAIMGFVQELKAENSIEALKKLCGFKAKVLRDHHKLEIDAKYLVVSFSTVTIRDRRMNYPKRGWFEVMLNRLNYKFTKFETSNEIFYIVRKN